MTPASTIRHLLRALVAALVMFSWNPANAQNTGGSTGKGTEQQTKPAETKPASEWKSPLEGSQSTAAERADFNKLVALWDKLLEAKDNLDYAKKCGTLEDEDAARKVLKAAKAELSAALDQYVLGYSNRYLGQKPPEPGVENAASDIFYFERGDTLKAIQSASKYRHKAVGDCPKKAAETPPAKTVPGETAPTHSSNRHKHKHHCTEDQPCYMENDQPAYAVAPKHPQHTDEGSGSGYPPPSEGDAGRDNPAGTQYRSPDDIPHGEPNPSGGNPWSQPP